MNKNMRYYNRIDEIKDINILSDLICKEYQLGSIKDTYVIEIGYEDFNAILTTSTGKYLMKVFRNSRSDEEVDQCINRSYIAMQNNVKTPKIYKNSEGNIVTIINHLNSRFRVSVIEYIDGNNFFDLKRKPTLDELMKIVDIGSNLNKIDYKPNFIYDTWAITSFCREFEKKKKYLEEKYLNIVEPIYNKFKKFDYDKLPKAFVHGDMMSTNLMLDKNDDIWVIDFSVSNYTARLNEIVVICDDVALIPNNKEESEMRIKMTFNEWCKKVEASEFEKESFQMLFDVANAINVLNPIYELATGNDSDETKMHLNAGLFALTLFK